MRTARTDELSRQEIAAVRELMLVSFPDSFSEEDWANSLGGVHVIAMEGNSPVAHASVVPRELRAGDIPLATGYVEAVATHPDHRRRGLASSVMGAIGDHIRATYQLGGLSTGEVSFYQRLGWEVWPGPSFVRVGEHVQPTPDEDGGIMVLKTPTTPSLDVLSALSCESRPGDVW